MAPTARLAQPAERKALNLVVVGSSPTVGARFLPGCDDNKCDTNTPEQFKTKTTNESRKRT